MTRQDLVNALNDINNLQGLRFATYEEVIEWLEKNHCLYKTEDIDDSYIDFTYENLDCSLNRQSNGSYELAPTVSIITEYGYIDVEV